MSYQTCPDWPELMELATQCVHLIEKIDDRFDRLLTPPPACGPGR